MEDDIKLSDLIDKFDEADRLTLDAREWSEKSRDYYDGNQYTSKELAIFAARGQPPTVNNRIAPMVDFLLGIELRSRTDPKVKPRGLSVELIDLRSIKPIDIHTILQSLGKTGHLLIVDGGWTVW